MMDSNELRRDVAGLPTGTACPVSRSHGDRCAVMRQPGQTSPDQQVMTNAVPTLKVNWANAVYRPSHEIVQAAHHDTNRMIRCLYMADDILRMSWQVQKKKRFTNYKEVPAASLADEAAAIYLAAWPDVEQLAFDVVPVVEEPLEMRSTGNFPCATVAFVQSETVPPGEALAAFTKLGFPGIGVLIEMDAGHVAMIRLSEVVSQNKWENLQRTLGLAVAKTYTWDHPSTVALPGFPKSKSGNPQGRVVHVDASAVGSVELVRSMAGVYAPPPRRLNLFERVIAEGVL